MSFRGIQSPTPIDPATQVGVVALTVAELQRSLDFYHEAIGLAVLEQDGAMAMLGVDDEPLLALQQQAGAKPWPRDGRSYTGLYHFAILLPTRADLGRWLQHWLELGYPLPGQGDHLVSEALYLEDPDGHGIEIYRDRPRSEWQWDDGAVRMASDPVDIRGLLDEAERSGQPWNGLPSGTFVGHIHLQVGDISQAADFYHGILGFDIVAAMPSALFISAGGYHHHIGMNIWHSRGASPPPVDSVRLRFFTVDLPDDVARRAVIERINAAGLTVSELAGSPAVQDPWGITIVLRSGAADDVQAAVSLATTAGV